MKNYFLLVVLGLLTFGMSMSSCSKDDDDTTVIDARDQYVGTWNSKEIGSLTFYSSGASIGTAPIDESGTIIISKSGDAGLMIDGKYFVVSDNNLSADPESITETDDEFNVVATAVYSGYLGLNTITINSTVTGTWSASNGLTGNLSGTAVTTLTK